MSRTSKKNHVLSLLANRETHFKDNQLKKSHRILRILVCDDGYEFRKVWDWMSWSPVNIEGNKVFLNNYHSVYDGYSKHYTAPIHRCNVPKIGTRASSMIDCLLSHPSPTHIDITGPYTDRPGAKMYAITKSSFVVVNFYTGQILFETGFHTVKSLKDISWRKIEESIVVSTILHSSSRTDGVLGRVVKMLAVFSIQPLRLDCVFEATRRVFGDTATNVELKEEFLFVMHTKGIVRLYDYEQLLKMHEVRHQTMENRCLGNDAPLKINMKLTELPPCLYEVKSEGWELQMGLNPWHYLVSPFHRVNTFNLVSFDTGTLAKNGVLTSTNYTIHPDRVEFHSDLSNRIVHIAYDQVRLLWMKEEGGKSVVRPHFTINVSSDVDTTPQITPVRRTSSGRRVKERFSTDQLYGNDVQIWGVCYEDELDLLSVTTTVGLPVETKGLMSLYDNNTGTHLKQIDMHETDKFYRVLQVKEYKAALDKDTVIQVAKYGSNVCHVQVYRLFEKVAPHRHVHLGLARDGNNQFEYPYVKEVLTLPPFV